jgi:hypothetical protein
MHVHTVTKRDMILKGKAYFDVIGQITKASAHPVPSRETRPPCNIIRARAS